MDLYVNLRDGAVTFKSLERAHRRDGIRLSRGERHPFNLYFHTDGTIARLTAGVTIALTVKPEGEFEADALAQTSAWTRGATDADPYTGKLSTNTAAINTALGFGGDGTVANDVAAIEDTECVVAWWPDGDEELPRFSQRFSIRIDNSPWNEAPDPDEIESYPAAAAILLKSGNLGGKLVLVDSVNGNDATGMRGTLKPFLTPAAAKAAATSGDLVIVGPGAYTTAANLYKDGVYWWSAPGAEISASNLNAIFSVSVGSTKILGHGKYTNSTPTGVNKAVLHLVSGDVEFEADYVRSTESGACPIQLDSGTFDIRVKKSVADAYDALIHYGGTGNVHIGSATAGDNAIEIGDASDSMNITVDELICTGSGAAVLMNGTGVVRLDVKRISATKAVQQSAGTLFLSGLTSDCFPQVTAGTLHWDVEQTTGGASTIGATISGGTARLSGVLNTAANSSANPITKSGGTLILDGATLLAHASRDSITAGTAQNVVSLGSHANKAKHGNITIQGGTLTVDSNVQ